MSIGGFMNDSIFIFKLNWKAILIMSTILSGCSHSLVHDDTVQDQAGTSHCSGSEWADNSSLAVIPIPVIAFISPHTDLNQIKADDYLKRCGDSSKLINREVSEGYGACVPLALTRILTLGIYQSCPVDISWEADVRP
jgi:hypothetical protein